MQRAKTQNRQDWELNVLSKLSASGALGKRAASYVADNNVRLSFAAQPTGARWTLMGMILGPKEIQINPNTEAGTRTAKDTWSISLIAHEAKHYEQGLFTALSVYGELEAWQLQMKVLRGLGAPPTHKNLLAIEKLKWSHDPKVLKEAARLMKELDPNYRIELLPLNPINLLDYLRPKK